MKLKLYQPTSFMDDDLKILQPFLDKDDVAFEDLPFNLVRMAIRSYDKDEQVLVIDHPHAY